MELYKFKDNKYLKYYTHIIENSIKKERSKKDKCYYEKHHIIPKSLGGSNSKINLVYLTAREHYVVHLLLVRIVQDSDVYKMINAVRRFAKKTSSSKEFEHLRRTISKYSKGSLNPSYGKLWIHNINTKEILYLKNDEFLKLDQNIFKKGLPYQRGGFKNRVYVNNSIHESLVPREEVDNYINNGWTLGRLKYATLEHMKKMSNNRHTPEKDANHSKELLGRIAIKNIKTGQVKKINPVDLPTYRELGFTDAVEITTALSRPVSILGKNYVSLSAASKDLNIYVQTLSYRLNNESDRWKEWKYL
jgi:hypothetical protein